jgi:ribose 1,5-bisphosphokinase PhnN
MVNDWDNVLHQNLKAQALTGDAAITAVLRQLQDALSRENFQNYTTYRLQINELVASAIAERQSKRGREAAPHLAQRKKREEEEARKKKEEQEADDRDGE